MKFVVCVLLVCVVGSVVAIPNQFCDDTAEKLITSNYERLSSEELVDSSTWFDSEEDGVYLNNFDNDIDNDGTLDYGLEGTLSGSPFAYPPCLPASCYSGVEAYPHNTAGHQASIMQDLIFEYSRRARPNNAAKNGRFSSMLWRCGYFNAITAFYNVSYIDIDKPNRDLKIYTCQKVQATGTSGQSGYAPVCAVTTDGSPRCTPDTSVPMTAWIKVWKNGVPKVTCDSLGVDSSVLNPDKDDGELTLASGLVFAAVGAVMGIALLLGLQLLFKRRKRRAPAEAAASVEQQQAVEASVSEVVNVSQLKNVELAQVAQAYHATEEGQESV